MQIQKVEESFFPIGRIDKLLRSGKVDVIGNIVAVVDNITTPTAALSHFLFAASFNKTASDTLKVFVNHECLGVT